MAGLKPVLLVRHAVALRRQDWDDDDAQRPLSERGRAQAEALVGHLAGFPVERVLSSPFVRCVQTVVPLAEARGLTVELAPELAEGAGQAAVRLARELTGRGVVLCSHGDVIPEVLGALDDGSVPEDLGRCKKGSTWVLEPLDGTVVPRRYLPPPG